jgi:hypothetical protein
VVQADRLARNCAARVAKAVAHEDWSLIPEEERMQIFLDKAERTGQTAYEDSRNQFSNFDFIVDIDRVTATGPSSYQVVADRQPYEVSLESGLKRVVEYKPRALYRIRRSP